MPINRNTSLPSVPGMGARNTGAVMEGINNALMMYLKLKDKQDEDAIKNRELTRQEGSAKALDQYYQGMTADRAADNARQQKELDYKNSLATLTNYAGGEVPESSPFVDQVERAGIPRDLAFTAKQTLPATRSQGAIGLPEGNPQQGSFTPQLTDKMPPVGPGTPPPVGWQDRQVNPSVAMGPSYFTAPQQAPQANTGQLNINVPESEKMRIAGLNIAGRQGVAETKATNNLDVAKINSGDKLAMLRQSEWYKVASLKLRQQGLQNELHRIEESILRDDNSATAKEFEMQLQKAALATKGGTDLSAIIRAVEGGGTPGAPGATAPGADIPIPTLRHPGSPTGAVKPPNPNDPLGLF